MKMIPYGRQTVTAADIKSVATTLKSDWITQGPRVDAFEKELAGFCGSRYAVAVSSGTAALHLACLAAGLQRGDEAITSPITFAATANAILYAGAKPIFADIDERTGNIDPLKIEEAVSRRTKVILPVHFAGLPCDMDMIYKISQKHNLVIIEDAAHALGASCRQGGQWHNVGCCRYSLMTIFSFHPLKGITTGEGGAITTNDKKIYERLKAFRSHGIYRAAAKGATRPWFYEMRALGFNYRLTDFQCALGIAQLERIGHFVRRRRAIAGYYNRLFRRLFRDNKSFDVLHVPADKKSACHLYAIILKGRFRRYRPQLFRHMRKKKIGVQVHYIPVYWHPFYQRLGYHKRLCPIAEDFYKGEITLPIFPTLRKSEIDYVVRAIFKFFE